MTSVLIRTDSFFRNILPENSIFTSGGAFMDIKFQNGKPYHTWQGREGYLKVMKTFGVACCTSDLCSVQLVPPDAIPPYLPTFLQPSWSPAPVTHFAACRNPCTGHARRLPNGSLATAWCKLVDIFGNFFSQPSFFEANFSSI